jgi:prepilin-type processing-associated H-X9-DG protein
MPRIPQRVVSVVLVAVVAVLLLGCGGVQQAAQRQKRANDLKQIGLAYQNYLDAEGKAPGQAADLQKYLLESPPTYQALVNGQYVVLWGATLQSMTAGTSNTVLGYEADVPTKGGNVLMGDGSVRIMTVPEFQAAPKAKTPAP